VSELQISPEFHPSRLAPKGDAQTTLTELAPKGITLIDAPLGRTPKDAWEGALDILIAQSNSAGEYTKIFENRLNLRFSDEQREQVIQDGVSLTRSITLQSASHQLHVVLRDVTTGATGSLRIPLR